MKRNIFQISEEVASSLATLTKRYTRVNMRRGDSTTHGRLEGPTSMAMLDGDAARVVIRPGSWEGSNMAQVFNLPRLCGVTR